MHFAQARLQQLSCSRSSSVSWLLQNVSKWWVCSVICEMGYVLHGGCEALSSGACSSSTIRVLHGVVHTDREKLFNPSSLFFTSHEIANVILTRAASRELQGTIKPEQFMQNQPHISWQALPKPYTHADAMFSLCVVPCIQASGA